MAFETWIGMDNGVGTILARGKMVKPFSIALDKEEHYLAQKSINTT